MKYPRIAEDRSQLETFAEESEKKVADLETVVGDEYSGLVKDVADLYDQIASINAFDGVLTTIYFGYIALKDTSIDLIKQNAGAVKYYKVIGTAQGYAFTDGNTVSSGIRVTMILNYDGVFMIREAIINSDSTNYTDISTGTKLYKHAISEALSQGSGFGFITNFSTKLTMDNFQSLIESPFSGKKEGWIFGTWGYQGGRMNVTTIGWNGSAFVIYGVKDGSFVNVTTSTITDSVTSL